MGRRPIGKQAMTDAERQRRRYAKIRRARKVAAHTVKRERRQAREVALVEVIRRAAAELTGSPLYGVILADPPWRWEVRDEDTGMDRAAENHYPTMPTDQIATLPVPAANDCALFLWATAPMLTAATAVMDAWGFTYKTHWVWVKGKGDLAEPEAIKRSTSMGFWTRNQHELLLLGTRGRPPGLTPWDPKEPSVIVAIRREHSRKPDEVAAMIERMFPTLPKLEMFRRGEARPGWAAWGAETVSSD
jgi:N6-adenosine-specific RNA methylase IME4